MACVLGIELVKQKNEARKGLFENNNALEPDFVGLAN